MNNKELAEKLEGLEEIFGEIKSLSDKYKDKDLNSSILEGQEYIASIRFCIE